MRPQKLRNSVGRSLLDIKNEYERTPVGKSKDLSTELTDDPRVRVGASKVTSSSKDARDSLLEASLLSKGRNSKLRDRSLGGILGSK